MSKALRDNDGKPDYFLLLDYLPLAMEELLKARQYGIKKYTRPEEGIDGRINFRASLGTEHHEEFQQGCRAGALRHLMKAYTEGRDVEQDNVHHLAFAALGALNALEYALSRRTLGDHASEALEQAMVEGWDRMKDAGLERQQQEIEVEEGEI